MNSRAKPPLKISACYLGPVFQLDAELTKHAQNLIYARNGTGKSFLSRAFRYLDLYQQGVDISNAALDLVSDEAIDGKGNIKLLRGTQELGKLFLKRKINTDSASVAAEVGETIFHVFSEDFVSTELRERKFEVDGDIDNEIAVDSDDIKLKEAADNIKARQEIHEAEYEKLNKAFETRKHEQLNKNARIRRNLNAYKDLTFPALFETYSEKPARPQRTVNELITNLEALKAIPVEPNFPLPVSGAVLNQFNVQAVNEQLAKITSPASISSKVKAKIDAHREFFKTGAGLVEHNNLKECPFCEQSITGTDPKKIIDAYIEYFNDEEEKHKSGLRSLSSQLNDVRQNINNTKHDLATQKAAYDKLKFFIPSQRESSLQLADQAVDELVMTLLDVDNAIKNKINSLASTVSVRTEYLAQGASAFDQIIGINNSLVERLKASVEKADEERRELQRHACRAFGTEFVREHWSDIKAVRSLECELNASRIHYENLEKAAPSQSARRRVATTFDMLLKHFFAERYVFDEHAFVIKRGDKKMARGLHRTLSDGEKTAIAFCYFIATIHRRVVANSDYRKMFLVFDDPVTSLSYDYVYTIAQTLKNLNISEQGDVSVNPSRVREHKGQRPSLLVLTHSSYFFNLARTNRIVNPNATFSLSSLGMKHELRPVEAYLAPFEQHLEHVYHVKNGDTPNQSTCNSIRSVLEAVGRFCRPDKAESLQEFIAVLADEDDIEIKSTLINSMSHGTYYNETPTREDVTLACEEAMKVVERYAKGHIEVLKKGDIASIN